MISDETTRQRIRTEHETTLFVEAGAGTGKTTALVARIVDALTTGRIAMRELAAITFTEQAAAELRDRITVALERCAADASTAPEVIEHARTALAHLDDAAISTIHGFAQRICSEFAPVVGLPPAIEVRDEIAAGIAFDLAWRRFLDSFYDATEHRALLRWAVALGFSVAHLRTIADALHANADRIDTTDFPIPAMPIIDLTPMIAAVRAACAFLSTCNDPDDRLALHLETLQRRADELAGLADVAGDLDLLDGLVQFPPCASRLGKAGAWDDKAAVVAALAEADTERCALLDALRSAVLRALTAHIATFVRRTVSARVHLGQLEFDDLLRIARNIVRDHPSVRAQLARRWQLLAVDEFQDTDPLQVELVLLLSDASTAATVELVQHATPAPGRLFLVGDPKQSIYRFRRADLTMYRSVVESVPGETIALQQNFRTIEPIVEWVNAVLATTMEARTEQAAWRALVAHRRDAPEERIGPPVVTFGGPRSGCSMNELRILEAESAVAAIARVCNEGWTVSDPTNASWRPARFSDIAILVPTRASVGPLERAFERAGIPVRIETRSLLWETPEVRELCMVLRAIDDPADPAAVVGALRTTALGCSDRDLVAHQRAGLTFDARRAVDGNDRVSTALRWINELHHARTWTPLSQLVERTVRERALLLAALAGPRARDRWRRLRLVLDIARAFDEAGAASLRSFLDWADEQRDRDAQVHDAIAPDPDDDAVRLMTVHAAKGLEFPITMLVGLHRKDPSSTSSVLWSRVHPAHIEVSVGAAALGLRTDGYDALAAVELAQDLAERDRLLYVAATRARDHLLVSRYCSDKGTTDATRLGAVIDTVVADTTAWPDDAVAPEAHAVSVESLATTPFSLADWERQRAALIARAGQPAARAATALAHADVPDSDAGDAPPTPGSTTTDDGPAWRRGRAATAIGRAVHAVLQVAELNNPESAVALAPAHAIAEGVADRADEIARLARAALHAPIIQAAAKSARVWREIPVGAPVGTSVIEGYIDLCFESPDGLVIVDYKTDAAYGAAAIAAAVQRYTPQGAAYAAALEATLGRPVAACVFVFCRPGTAIEAPIPDLAEALAALRAELGADQPG